MTAASPQPGDTLVTDTRAVPGIEEALAWLAEHAHENLGTEISLRQATPAHQVSFAHRGGGLAGVSVAAPGGQWFLEADRLRAAVDLVAGVATLAASAGQWPAKVTTSGAVKTWLRPLLAGRGIAPIREHDLLAMACSQLPSGGEGRWATLADRGALERYQELYNEERRTTIAADWRSVLARQAVAVLEEDGRIIAVVKRTADTARYATIGGTWTDPAYRGRGVAKRLTAFLVGELLAERPAVHLIVDDDNTAAIALYRSLGFEQIGSCYMGYVP
jgi:ribosomal protein S18 acetylase RimI-like enzyme